MSAPIKSAKREFVMPAEGTEAYDELKARWESKPVTFGQCGRLKKLFHAANEAGGYAGKVSPKWEARMDYLTTRDESGRWTVLRTDNENLNMTMWGAHILGKTLEGIAAGAPVTESKSDPKPEIAAEFKVAAEFKSRSDVNFSDGDVILVKGEAFVLGTTGRRAYLARA